MKKVLIEIPDAEIYLYMSYGGTNGQRLMSYIANGKFLPDNPTNGDIIKVMFPNQNSNNGDNVALLDLDGFVVTTFPKKWWNAPYRKDGET